MIPKIVCPHCGSEHAVLSGYEDGGGDFADSIAEMWGCLDCGQQIAGPEYWIDDDDDDSEENSWPCP